MTRKIVAFMSVPLAVWVAVYIVARPAWTAEPTAITWVPTNPMHKARSFFAVAQLLNGNVLVAGGFDSGLTFPDAEIYDWRAGIWTTIAPMRQERAAPVALTLEDGRVMVIGGADQNFNFLNTVEIYDPRTNTWSFTGSMNDLHFEDFVAVRLPGRRVLVAGGYVSCCFTPLNSAEIFDEASGTWTRTGNMNLARGEFANVLLQDGRVLAIGGITEGGAPTATAEIYNPVTGVWTFTGSMNVARSDHAAVRLEDGRVLVAGGDSSEDFPRFVSAEIFDPRTGKWTLTGDMSTGRSETEYAAVLLRNGQVLVPGGHQAAETPVSSADLYDPKTGTWTQAGSMSSGRAGHAAVLLPGSRGALVMGGLSQPPAATASADIAVSIH